MHAWVKLPSDPPTERWLYDLLPHGNLGVDLAGEAIGVRLFGDKETTYICHTLTGHLQIDHHEVVAVDAPRKPSESEPGELKRFPSLVAAQHYLEDQMRAALQCNVEALGGTVVWPARDKEE